MAKFSEFDLRAYLAEVNKVSLLTAEEEKSLARAIKRGDKKAREKFIRANLRLVLSFARRYRNRGLPFVYLIEEGNLGLLTAVERFNPNRGTRFSTYATWWIKHYMMQALLNANKVIRVPTHVVEVIARWKHASRDLAQKLGRTPEMHEVTKEVQVSPERFRAFRKVLQSGLSAKKALSLELVFWKGIAAPTESVVATEDMFEIEEMERLNNLINSLSELESTVLKMHCGLGTKDQQPLTLRQISKKLHCSYEWVRLLEKKALEKLHYLLKNR